MKKLIDFTAWYADRKRIEACASEFEELVKAQTENDWLEIIRQNFYWVCEHNIGGINKVVKDARSFREGFAPVKCSSSGLWGFMKTDGTMLTGFEFYNVGGFKDGFSAVEDSSSGMWGFLKSDGTMLTGFQFGYVSDFQEGFARVQDSSGMWGFLKSDGTMLTGFEFYDANSFREGFATVKDSSGLCGFLKSDGTMLTEFKFDAVRNFREGFAHVQKDKCGEWGWINAQGEYTLTKEV